MEATSSRWSVLICHRLNLNENLGHTFALAGLMEIPDASRSDIEYPLFVVSCALMKSMTL